MPFLIKSLLLRFAGGRGEPLPRDAEVGILAFEAARAMSRLVALHRGLTPSSVRLLENTTIRSVGVSCLSSYDRLFFLRIACAEMLDELGRAASTISRLASRSRSPWPRGFPHLFSTLGSGNFDLDHEIVLSSKTLKRKLRKMEASVSSTSILYTEMETLAEMEASERRLQRWKRDSGPIPRDDPPAVDGFLTKLSAQKRLVDKSNDSSLWRQSKEKTSESMARVAVTLFILICDVFGEFVPELPVVNRSKERFRSRPNREHHHSCPIERSFDAMMRFSSGSIVRYTNTPAKTDLNKWSARTMKPPAGTVGAAGLALRYADLIQLADKIFQSPEYFGQEDREDLYQMLPRSLRSAVRAKLRGVSTLLAGGRIKTAESVLGWLAPVANDTSKWFSDRSCEKQRIDPATKVLMLQTLQISDRAKAEAAIVDVLVGLSLLYRRRHCSET